MNSLAEKQASEAQGERGTREFERGVRRGQLEKRAGETAADGRSTSPVRDRRDCTQVAHTQIDRGVDVSKPAMGSTREMSGAFAVAAERRGVEKKMSD